MCPAPLLLLLAVIAWVVAFEYRGTVDSPRWRAGWDQAIFWGSALPALLWGVAPDTIVRGARPVATAPRVGEAWVR
jgi:cytochrome d ubiquinol oxidase subunit II